MSLIELSEPAKDQIRDQLNSRGSGVGVRLGVKTTGCSGLAYLMEFVDQIEACDNVIDVDDVKLIIDPKSLVYLKGTRLDFVKEGLNEGFQFENPNARGACGCGESFTV